MDNKQIDILEKLPVNEALIKLALPSIIAMLVNIVYNLADTFFIGQLNDPNQVAAISVAMPLMMIMTALGGIFGSGGASYLSRLIGKKDYDSANKTVSNVFFSSIIVSFIISIIMFIFATPILKISGASTNTIDYALSYVKIIITSNVITMINAVMNGLIRAEGATKKSMGGMLIGSVLNIILDPILILGFNMGVEGAAIATVIGKIASSIYYLTYYLKGKSTAVLSYKNFCFSKQIYIEVFKIGIPASLSQIIMSLSMGFMNNIASNYGDNFLAAMGINLRIISIAFMVLFGLAAGYQPLAGYSYGSKNYKRFFKSTKISMIYASVLAVFFTIIFAVFSKSIIYAFIKDAEVVKHGIKLIRANILVLPLMGIQIVMMSAFQALGKGIPSLILSLARQGIFLIPLLIILPKLFDINGLIYSQPIADFLAFILSCLLFSKLIKNLKHEEEKNKKEKIAA